MATATATSSRFLPATTTHQTLLSFTKPLFSLKTTTTTTISIRTRLTTRLHVSTTTTTTNNNNNPIPKETIFFDGGAHYGDLVANLLLGFTLVWLPLTLAAVLRGFFLRYRFTNLRVTVISGLTGQDRSDFSYKVIKDVQVVPRFIGEWGDVIITLKDGTKVDLRSVPRFREIAAYCSSMASADESEQTTTTATAAKGF